MLAICKNMQILKYMQICLPYANGFSELAVCTFDVNIASNLVMFVLRYVCAALCSCCIMFVLHYVRVEKDVCQSNYCSYNVFLK